MVETNGFPASLWCAKDLPHLPQFLVELISKAQAEVDPKKIVLFGSRARCDHSPQSDYDICIYNESSQTWTPEKWTRFVVDFDENKSTLCSIDLINYSEAHDDLKSKIDQTGIILYERN